MGANVSNGMENFSETVGQATTKPAIGITPAIPVITSNIFFDKKVLIKHNLKNYTLDIIKISAGNIYNNIALTMTSIPVGPQKIIPPPSIFGKPIIKSDGTPYRAGIEVPVAAVKNPDVLPDINNVACKDPAYPCDCENLKFTLEISKISEIKDTLPTIVLSMQVNFKENSSITNIQSFIVGDTNRDTFYIWKLVKNVPFNNDKTDCYINLVGNFSFVEPNKPNVYMTTWPATTSPATTEPPLPSNLLSTYSNYISNMYNSSSR
jgi:hypothetical protein